MLQLRPWFLLALLACPASPLLAQEERVVQEGPGNKGSRPSRENPNNAPHIGEEVVVQRGERPLYMEFVRANEDPATPMLVMFHRSNSSKGEYWEIAPRLRDLGYNCLAVDLSTGGRCKGVPNYTALSRKHGSTFARTQRDIKDALEWAREKSPQGKVVAWGSSFSASLVLRIAALQPELIDGAIAFSPGEYFLEPGTGPTWVTDACRKLECPVFVTSARAEESDWKPIFEVIPSTKKTGFLPQGPGRSGSTALWSECGESEEYWKATLAFLEQHFPSRAAGQGEPAEGETKDG